MHKSIYLSLLLLSSLFLLTAASTPPADKKITAENLYNIPVADTLTWKMLAQIKYINKTTDDYPEGVMYPLINPKLKSKNKKQIVISGFIVPIDNKTYALSKNVFASCFFCGKAGPETIMGIQFKDSSMRLKTDQYVTLKGNFRYNDSDVNDWIYHIDNAVITKGN